MLGQVEELRVTDTEAEPDTVSLTVQTRARLIMTEFLLALSSLGNVN